MGAVISNYPNEIVTCDLLELWNLFKLDYIYDLFEQLVLHVIEVFCCC